MYLTKTRNWIGCNSNSYVTFFDKKCCFLSTLLQCGISTMSKEFQCAERTKNRHNFSFSVPLLNKNFTKFYTTSCDVSWCSVATSFHSTLIFKRLCKYTQTNSIHHMELIYVERQTERQTERHNYTWQSQTLVKCLWTHLRFDFY
jgi:hypothetical protein